MSHWSTIEQLVYGPTYKPNPFRVNERVGLLVQDLDSVLKRTTYLLTLKGMSEFCLTLYVPSHPPDITSKLGGLSGQRHWAVIAYTYLRIISCEQKLIVSLGLKLSYLGHYNQNSQFYIFNNVIT